MIPLPTAPPKAAFAVNAHSRIIHQRQRRGTGSSIDEDYDAAERIGNRHEGHEFLANVGDGLDAAKDNDGNEDRDDDGDAPTWE